MFNLIEEKALAFWVSLNDRVRQLKDEAGQTSAEYIAVTAVAVLIAITVIYAAFSSQLSSAITTIGTELESWVTGAFDGAPDPTPPAP